MTTFTRSVTASVLAGATLLAAAAPKLYGQVRGLAVRSIPPRIHQVPPYHTPSVLAWGAAGMSSSATRAGPTSVTTTTSGGTTQLSVSRSVMSPQTSPFFMRSNNMAFLRHMDHVRHLERRAFDAGVISTLTGGFGGYGAAAMGSLYGTPYFSSYGNPYTTPYSGSSSYRSNTNNYVQEPPAAPPAVAQDQADRARNNPPTGEIMSGQAMNDILADLRKVATDKPDALPAVALPLDDKAKTHINLTRGTGNIALLKPGDTIPWPTAFNGPEYEDQRAKLTARATAAVKQAQANGHVEVELTTPLATEVDAFQKELRRIAPSLSFEQHREAKDFLNALDAAVVALQQSDVANYFNGKYALTAKTIPEMVRYMTQNALKFAPAAPGDEEAYTKLYNSMSAYDRSLKTAKSVE